MRYTFVSIQVDFNKGKQIVVLCQEENAHRAVR